MEIESVTDDELVGYLEGDIVQLALLSRRVQTCIEAGRFVWR